jgi:hypothetical protein
VATNGPIVHTRVICTDSHGDFDVGWGKLLTHPPELYGNHISRDIWKRVEEKDEGVRIFLISI